MDARDLVPSDASGGEGSTAIDAHGDVSTGYGPDASLRDAPPETAAHDASDAPTDAPVETSIEASRADGPLPVDGSTADGALPVDGSIADGTLPVDGSVLDGTLPVDGSADDGSTSMGASLIDAPSDALSLPPDLADGGPPPPDPTSASSYLINTAHTNAVVGSTLKPPLVRAWTADLPGEPSYPLIAQGRVYVVASAAGSSTSNTATVLAFDAQNGTPVWSASLPIASDAGIAYDDGRIFTADSSGFVSAFDASTGALAWTHSMAGPFTIAFSTKVTAYRGVVYTNAGGDGGTLFAYDESTGALLFQNYDPSRGYDSPLAVEDRGVVVAFACEQTYKLDRLTGALVWHYSTACGGGGADVPVLAHDRVYVTESFIGNVMVDDDNGVGAGSFVASFPPSFDGAFDVSVWGIPFMNNQLTAVDATTGLTAWTFPLDNQQFLEQPLLAGGHAYTLDSSGTLTAFDEATGKPVWTDGATTTLNGVSYPLQPMAASGDRLVVPEATQLVAYGSSGDGGGGSTGTGADGGCAFNMADVAEPAAGQGASYVAMGDLNGDGKPDIAVADLNQYGPGAVSVLLGNGDGTFQPAIADATGMATNCVAIADLNGDGRPDLVVLDAGSILGGSTVPGNVGVLLGNGDGTFQPEVTYPTGAGGAELVVVDLDGDGKLDVAVANDALGNLSILLGNGDGSLRPVVTTFDPNRRISVSIAAGDLNGDGRPDLVVSDEEYDVDVLINTGDGTFQPAAPYPTFALSCCLTEPHAVAIADVDGDGKLDVAVANYGAGSVSIFRGNGDGTLQTQVPYAIDASPQMVRFGDVNGDGILDVVVTESVSPDLSMLLGNGDGTFQPQKFFAVKGGTFAMAVGDVNGDRKADIVATSGSTNVGVLLSSCGH